jgi:hypothetical protein
VYEKGNFAKMYYSDSCLLGLIVVAASKVAFYSDLPEAGSSPSIYLKWRLCKYIPCHAVALEMFVSGSARPSPGGVCEPPRSDIWTPA